jgi:uncharacterized membrane protein YbhN (UPF0104 family)
MGCEGDRNPVQDRCNAGASRVCVALEGCAIPRAASVVADDAHEVHGLHMEGSVRGLVVAFGEREQLGAAVGPAALGGEPDGAVPSRAQVRSSTSRTSTETRSSGAPWRLGRWTRRSVPSFGWVASVPGPSVPVAGSAPTGPSRRWRGAGRWAGLIARARGFGRRRRGPITVLASLGTAAVLVVLLAGRRDEFLAALSAAAVWVLALTVLLQIVALVARSEAWHLTIEAAGGTVDRRVLYRASSMQVLGSVINGHLGVAARITALRRSSPEVSPQVPTLIAAEFPILAVEAMLAALASFTLVAPLGLPWWLPIVGLAVVGAASAGLRHLALRKGRELWSGLAVLRSLNGGTRVVGFVLVAVFAQILRNWLLLRAVGVDASLFDATAVLIAVVTLGQLPVGPSVGAAAAVLILGSRGVAAAAAAGVLTTVTGTVGGLCFAAWAGGDQLWAATRRAARRRSAVRRSREQTSEDTFEP